jgi:hypothetical protein
MEDMRVLPAANMLDCLGDGETVVRTLLRLSDGLISLYEL